MIAERVRRLGGNRGGILGARYKTSRGGCKEGNIGGRVVGNDPGHLPAWPAHSKRRGVDRRRVHRLAECCADNRDVGANNGRAVQRRYSGHCRRR